MFRTTWDYFFRFDEFSAWLDRVSALTHLINPVEQVRWNMDKHYLRDLEAYVERHPEVDFVNASRAGARIKGVRYEEEEHAA